MYTTNTHNEVMQQIPHIANSQLINGYQLLSRFMYKERYGKCIVPDLRRKIRFLKLLHKRLSYFSSTMILLIKGDYWQK